ncbi:hypothetical protein [Parasitella parasitica]|uniref:Mtf2-like C-terminal domain-containing protein n=1 Tax=Parasitella parasitica TaxID=35722 RepID=A0A0B7NLU8_9FUNG|nr:hypothetical protein [Parasitella parasitica]
MKLAIRFRLPRQQSFMLSKLYSTEQHKTGKQESIQNEPSLEKEYEAKPELELWELKSSKPPAEDPEPIRKPRLRDQMLRDTLIKYADRKEKFTKDFIDRVIPSSASSYEANHIQSQRILEIVASKKSTPILKKKPLPQSAVGSIFFNNKRQKREPIDDHLYNYLLPIERNEYNWDQAVVSKSERIALKQEEMESIQAILEAPTTLDLWHCIESEINRDDYPKFYPSVLTKAIEHASKIDPYMALTFFEKAKQKSLTSYISGCTVQVYNAVLLLRWEVWRDINGMLDLAEEMTVNGIEFDNNSRRIVRAVVQEIEAEGAYSDEDTDGVFWNAEERRSCNILKELAVKWMISE